MLASDWTQLRGSHAMHRRYVSCYRKRLSWAGKRTICTDFDEKKKNYSLLSATPFRKLQPVDKLICCKTGLIRGL